jgi:hypothetical protein
VGAHHAAADASVAAFVDGAESVYEEVVADVAPGKPFGVGVKGVDGADQARGVRLCVGAAACRVVDEGHLDRSVRGRTGAEALVRAPLGPGDHGGRGRRRDGRLVEAEAGHCGGHAPGGARETGDDAGLATGVDGDDADAGEGLWAAGRSGGLDLQVAGLAGPHRIGERLARGPLAGDLEGHREPGPPTCAVAAGSELDVHGRAGRRIAEHAGDREGLAGVERGRGRDIARR